MRVISLILLLIISGTGFSQEYYLFAGTYTNAEKSKGIYVYKFNAKTGTATFVSSKFTDNPSYLALDNNSSHLYAVNEQGDGHGAVSSFSFDKKSGRLDFINKQTAHGDDPCYISIDAINKWAVVANYSGGNFSIYQIKKNGSLDTAVQIIQHTGHGVNKDRQEKAHVHSAVFSPDKHFLAVTDLGTDKITLYPFDASKEKPITGQPFEINTAAGSGPRHIIFHPSKPFAYVIEEMSGNVTAYDYENDRLGPIQTISAHPADFKGAKGSAAIHFSSDGKFLYTSNRGESNSIAVFSVNSSTGKLTLAGIQSCGGKEPRGFSIDPSGKFLLSGNMNSGDISIFRLNPKTGLLSNTGRKIAIPKPTYLLFTHIK
jgi:6-phosphogluconolactonase